MIIVTIDGTEIKAAYPYPVIWMQISTVKKVKSKKC